jgi:hypothetical protein
MPRLLRPGEQTSTLANPWQAQSITTRDSATAAPHAGRLRQWGALHLAVLTPALAV